MDVLNLKIPRTLVLETEANPQPPYLLERRRFPRLSFRESLRFRGLFEPHQVFCGAMARDLSASGVRIHTAEFLPRETRLVVLLDLPGKIDPIRAIGQVLWVEQDHISGRFKCGLEFIEIMPEDRTLIADHVEWGPPLA